MALPLNCDTTVVSLKTMMRPFLFVGLAILWSLLVTGCASHPASPPKTTGIPVIFDTDIGDDIDDTWALGFLLRCPELDVKLVVGDNGKAEYRAKLLARFLETAGRSDIPVGLGLEVPHDGTSRQREWIKDYDLKKYPGKVQADGVQAIIDTILQSPQPVTIIAVGPVQNIAEALRREPRIAERARFVGMHGSVRVGYQNDPKIAPEYNVKLAPQACRTVFTAPWDITITPVDTCDKLNLQDAKYQHVFTSADPIAKATIENYRLWAIAGQQGLPEAFPVRSTTLFDVVAVYLAFSDAWCGMETIGLRVTDDGLTVEDPGAKQMNVALTWKNLPALEDLLVERLINGR